MIEPFYEMISGKHIKKLIKNIQYHYFSNTKNANLIGKYLYKKCVPINVHLIIEFIIC